jgi:hypothetical protein
MQDPKSWFLGCLICLYALYGIGTGQTYLPVKYDGLVLINRYDDFALYWHILSVVSYLGIYLIKQGYAKKKTRSKPLTFKGINEYNNFKKAEKRLGFAPFAWGIAGFFIVFPLWYLVDYNFNSTMNDCNICLIDEGWSNLILFNSLFLFPIIFFKLSLKIMSSRLISDGKITSSSFKHMRSEGRPGSRFSSKGRGDYGGDSGGDCGGE